MQAVADLPFVAQRPRALVVDDDDLVRTTAVDALATLGIEATAASGVAEALGVMRPAELDLVLTDLRMPDGDGLDLLSAVKQLDPTLPVVLMTGFGDVAASIAAFRRSADDFLQKPLESSELDRVCRRAVDRGRLLRENRRQRETLERLYRMKSEFLAGMSHELRTPLTTIIGMSEVLGEGTLGELNSRQEKYVRTIQQSAGHLLDLINDILDYSKVEAAEMTLSVGEQDAAELVGAAGAVVAGRAHEKQIRVDLQCELEDLCLVADRNKVIQILINLLSNAIKFSAAGCSVTVVLDGDDDGLSFAVIDHGVGIAADQQERVFEAFQQVHSGASGKDPGTGLGLALSRHLARMHGGEVSVASAPGAGSTFTLKLPRVPVAGRAIEAFPRQE